MCQQFVFDAMKIQAAPYPALTVVDYNVVRKSNIKELNNLCDTDSSMHSDHFYSISVNLFCGDVLSC